MALEKCIIRRSEQSLGHIDTISQLLKTIEADPSLLTQRIYDLHHAHLRVMERMGTDTDAAKYPHVLQLKDTLNLHEAFLDTRSPLNIDSMPNLSRRADQTFKYIASHTDTDWSFISTTPDLNKLMSKMIIKGFALFLELDTKVDQLAVSYEMAMTEVLKTDFADSVLAKDL